MKNEKIECCKTIITLCDREDTLFIKGKNVHIQTSVMAWTLYCSACNTLLKTLKPPIDNNVYIVIMDDYEWENGYKPLKILK
jgi:hypothetical protein